MTTMQKTGIIVNLIFRDYVLNSFTPDDFFGMSEELWGEILPEIKEYAEEKGEEFPFTETNIPEIKAIVDALFADEFSTTENEGYTVKDITETYTVSEEAAALAIACRRNRDTVAGYRAYYLLERIVTEEDMSTEILFDVAADFAWDDRLENAMNAFYRAGGID